MNEIRFYYVFTLSESFADALFANIIHLNVEPYLAVITDTGGGEW